MHKNPAGPEVIRSVISKAERSGKDQDLMLLPIISGLCESPGIPYPPYSIKHLVSSIQHRAAKAAYTTYPPNKKTEINKIILRRYGKKYIFAA